MNVYVFQLFAIGFFAKYYYIIGIAAIIICFYFWRCHNRFIAILLPLYVIVIAVTVYLPLILGIDETHKIPLGINEHFQDRVSLKYGLEEFYLRGQQAIAKNETNMWFYKYWPPYYFDAVDEKYYSGTIRYSKEPPRFLSNITILRAEENKKDEEITEENQSAWKYDYIFTANDALLIKLLKNTEFKVILLIFLGIQLFFFTISFAWHKKYKLSLYNRIIHIILVFLIIILVEAIGLCYFSVSSLNPRRLINIMNASDANSFFNELQNKTSQSGVQKIKPPFNLTEKTFFVSKNNFLPTNYTRMNIDLFQYIFYAESPHDIVHPKRMKITKIGKKLYWGHYDEYIRLNNQTTVHIRLILFLQLLVGGLSAYFLLIEPKFYFIKNLSSQPKKNRENVIPQK